MLCVDCKYGHECPYMGADDMMHALVVEGDEKVVKLMGEVNVLLEKLKARVKEVFEMSKRFDLHVDVAQCEGFEELFKMSWDNEDTLALNVLITELHRLAGDCRSKVGVRVPFEVFEGVVGALERCSIIAMGRGEVSEN